jgi:hypothetical protein
MLTYKTDWSNSLHFFKQLFITFVIILLPILYDLLFSTTFIKEMYYELAATLLLIRIIDETSKKRLKEVRFDKDKNQIIFTYKLLLSTTKQKTLSFENARLEITESKSKKFSLWDPLTLYFLNGKKEIFEIKKSKDGFSVNTLRQITITAENLSLPILKA